ncbi:MAG: T9SS type A sorting domain-containing protein [Bacteroidia bacterium]
MKKIFFTFTCIAWVLLSNAAILHVPLVYSGIQVAINASANGDTIIVAPGIYYENINFRGKKILLTSLFYVSRDTSFVNATIINGSTPVNADTASCVIFNSGEDSTSVLQGFTITGGAGTKWTDIHGAGIYREGGGVLMDLSSPTICFNIIVNNKAINTTSVTSAGGGGIRIGDGAPYILNNIIINNQGKYGPGIVLNYTGCTIRNNIISNNTGATSYSGGGGIWMYSNHSMNYAKIIENNTIINNSSYAAGTGGISIQSATNVFLKNNIFWNNIPLTTQIKNIGSTIRAAYNDVEGGYTGTGNMNADPLLDNCYLLSSTSPCIDKGDSLSLYNDAVTSQSVAIFPSMGTQKNDIGAYGGPQAFMLYCSTTLTAIKQNNLQNEVFNVYPNPSNGIFFIETTPFQKDISISIEDIQGRIILEDKLTESKTSFGMNTIAGFYFIKIYDKAMGLLSVKKIYITQ